MAISELDLPTGVLAHSLSNADQQARLLADRVAQALQFAIHADGQASLLVSGGKSPIAFFEYLAQKELDWAQVTISLTDERWVPPEHPDSNEGLVRRHLLQHQAAVAQFVSLYYPAPTLEESAHKAEQVLQVLPKKPDVVVLGMGSDGHTASLFPGSPLLYQALNPECALRCLPMQAPSEPRQRISLTYPFLASAPVQYLAIQGHGKFLALSRALQAHSVQMPVHAFLHHPLEIYWCP